MAKRNTNNRKQRGMILNGAVSVLRTRGLQSLSFDNVANEAGLSRQLVRYYYPSLEALMVDLCDELAGGYRDILTTGVVEVAQVERLDFFLDFFFGVASEFPMPHNSEVYDAFFAFAVGSDDLQDRLCDTYRMLGQVFVHELSITHPELADFAAEELSFLIVSMMHAHWSYIATLGFSEEHGKVTRKAVDRLIKSYLHETETAPLMDRPWSRQT